MYSLCFALPTDRADIVRAATEALVWALADVNGLYLRTGTFPLLYQSGVRYVADTSEPEMQWWPVPVVLSQGYADCKALAAWRVAELRARGIDARPRVTQRRNGAIYQHVTVSLPWGDEDPSRLLGMR